MDPKVHHSVHKSPQFSPVWFMLSVKFDDVLFAVIIAMGHISKTDRYWQVNGPFFTFCDVMSTYKPVHGERGLGAGGSGGL
jgi:hypothetical protein